MIMLRGAAEHDRADAAPWLIIAYIFGVLVGAWLAWRRGSWFEGIAIPSGADLARRARVLARHGVAGALRLPARLVSIGRRQQSGRNLYPRSVARLTSADFLYHLILPATTLALYLQGLPLLLMRSNMLDVMQRGLHHHGQHEGPAGVADRACAMRPATRCCPSSRRSRSGFGASVGGNVVIETVFSWPGLGRLLVAQWPARDYPLAQGAFMFIALVLIMMNFIADLLYTVLDPRVSHGDAADPVSAGAGHAPLHALAHQLGAFMAGACRARPLRHRRHGDLRHCSCWSRCSPTC